MSLKTTNGVGLKKLASLILYTKHMLKSITFNDIFNSKVVALYNLDK